MGQSHFNVVDGGAGQLQLVDTKGHVRFNVVLHS